MRTPELETTRLYLRPPRVEDAEEVFQNWTSDGEVTRYLRWTTHKSPEETKEWLALEERYLESDKRYQWVFVHKETGRLIGSGGFIWNEERNMFELGYVFMRDFWGQGLATEAGRAMVDFAVNTLGLRTLFARHAKQNTASGRVLEKLGFAYQCDGACRTFDGSVTLESRDYILTVPEP